MPKFAKIFRKKSKDIGERFEGRFAIRSAGRNAGTNSDGTSVGIFDQLDK